MPMELLDEEKRLIERNRTRISVLIPLWLVTMLWMIHFVQWGFSVDLGFLGILPRTFSGLKGIFSGPFIHGSWAHLGGNSLPLLALGFTLIYFYHHIAYRIVVFIWLITGLTVWLIGRESYHIGASGVIYGMASFLFFSGLLRRNKRLLAVALVVVFLYGGMVWGLFPYLADISWEAHLAGFASGLLLAFLFRSSGPSDDVVPEWMAEDENAQPEELKIVSPEEKEKKTAPADWSGEVPVYRNSRDEESD